MAYAAVIQGQTAENLRDFGSTFSEVCGNIGLTSNGRVSVVVEQKENQKDALCGIR